MADQELLEGEDENELSEQKEEEGDESAIATQTIEINRLKQRVEVLKNINEKQRTQFKEEMKALLKPLMQKHKEIQKENAFLKEQIRLFSQVKGYVPKTRPFDDDKAKDAKIEQQKQENDILQKMIRKLEDDYNHLRKENAALVLERDHFAEQAGADFSQADDIIRALEKEKIELIEIIKEKDAIITQISAQSTDMNVNLVDFGMPESTELPQDKELVKLKKQMMNYENTFNIIEQEMVNQNSTYDEILASLKESKKFLTQHFSNV